MSDRKPMSPEKASNIARLVAELAKLGAQHRSFKLDPPPIYDKHFTDFMEALDDE